MTAVFGKRPERLGLRVAPTFDEAISQRLNRIKLPSLKSTEFWNSPAYQGLLNLQQAVETEAELDARRATLKSLMTRVAQEHHVSVTHVRQMVQGAARAGAFDISGGDAPMDVPPGDWYDDDRRGPPPPQPPRRGPCPLYPPDAADE